MIECLTIKTKYHVHRGVQIETQDMSIYTNVNCIFSDERFSKIFDLHFEEIRKKIPNLLSVRKILTNEYGDQLQTYTVIPFNKDLEVHVDRLIETFERMLK